MADHSTSPTAEQRVEDTGRRLTESELDDLAWAVRRYQETVVSAHYKPASEARRANRLEGLLHRLEADGCLFSDIDALDKPTSALSAAIAEKKRLTTALADAQRDGERLDWLESTGGEPSRSREDGDSWLVFRTGYRHAGAMFTITPQLTLRDAIDAAMSRSTNGEGNG